MAQRDLSSIVNRALKVAGMAGYIVTIGLLLVWSFSAPYSGKTRVYAQGRKGNPVRKVSKSGEKLERATRKLENKASEALAAHVISVQSEIPATELLARAEGIGAVAPAAIAARITHESLGQVLAGLASGKSLGQVVVSAGVPVTVAQTMLTRALVGVNDNMRAAAKALRDTDHDGIPSAMDDDVDGDGIANRDDVDVDGDGTPNADDDDVDDDGMANADDDDVDGDGVANGDDNDIDGDGMDNSSDDDDDGDDVSDDTDGDEDGDGVGDDTEDDGDDDDNDNGNANGNTNENENDNDNANDNENENENENGNANQNGNSNQNDNDNGNGNGGRPA